jgi:hypothetical protein
MGIDVNAGYNVAAANNPSIVKQVIPLGLAWNRAITTGFADDNPYNGINPGQVNLWASDSYHASNLGYYLHALMDFGAITGVDPRTLGSGETAAAALGISGAQAVTLQNIAAAQLAPVPEPATWLMCLLGCGAIGLKRLRVSATAPAGA